MHAHSDVAEVLDRLGELATVRRPDDALLAPFLVAVLLRTARRGRRRPQDRRHLRGRRRPPRPRPQAARRLAVIRVVSPDRERDGWSTPHSVVLVVTDDMPFLVDTMRMLLERHGLDIRLLVHPILLVERDGADVMQRVAPFSDRLEGAPTSRCSSRRGRRSRSTASTTSWQRRSRQSSLRRSPTCAGWSPTSARCATACAP